MASLYIKDEETTAAVTRLAKRLGVTKTQAVRDAIRRVESELPPETAPQKADNTAEWLRDFRRRNPLPPPTGLAADKAFYDWLSGEEDIPDA